MNTFLLTIFAGLNFMVGTEPAPLIDSGILTEIGNLLTTFLGWVVENRMILIFFTLGILSFVIGLFARAKRTVK